MKPAILAILCIWTLAACKEELAAIPEPVTMTSEALGHYCQMNLAEHPGPKAQVHLKGIDAPIYFAQVRDAIAYQRMPEQSHAIAAIYVNDMSVAPSWEEPGLDNWLLASSAHFVIGSDMIGGMGASELVPFSGLEKAKDFAAKHGGHVVGIAAIADTDVLVPDQTSPDQEVDPDFVNRLGRFVREGNG